MTVTRVAIMAMAALLVAAPQASAQPHGYAQPPEYIQPSEMGQPCSAGQPCDCGPACQGCRAGGGCCEGQCVDGMCYPKRSTWGFYQQRWKRWPGEYDDAAPTTRAEQGEGELPGVNIEIPPAEEDLQAPPPTEQERPEGPAEDEETSEEEGGAAEIRLPPLPPLGTPPGSTLGNPPPAFPGFPTQPPADMRPPTETGPDPEGEFSQHRPVLRRLAPVVEDAPPALPRGFMKLLSRGTAEPASYTPAQPGQGRPYQVQPATAHRLPSVR